MKKKLLLLFLPILLLTGCNNSSGGAIPTKEREQIELTLNNYSKYIAVYTISDSYGTNYSYSIYRYQFVGSSLCKFNDCSIVYTFTTNSGKVSETEYTTNLTISGCGETKEVSFGYSNLDSAYFRLKIKAVNGIIEVLY